MVENNTQFILTYCVKYSTILHNQLFELRKFFTTDIFYCVLFSYLD
nr:MAG TPA: hypothetical protein [Caudoviricetes sp.]